MSKKITQQRACYFNLSIKIGMVMTMFWFLQLQLQAQVASSANYTFSTGTTGNLALDMNGNPINMAAQPDLAQAASSSSLAVTDLGFDFWFMGTRYFQVTPQVRGAVGMGPLPLVAGAPNLNVSSNTTAPMLAPLWNQSAFTPIAGKNIRSLVTGTAPNRCFVVEWNVMAQNNSLSNTADMTFQMRIYENTGAIEYVYGNMQMPANTFSGSFQAAIGFTNLQNLNNTLASVTDLTTYTASTLAASVNNQVVSQNMAGSIPGLSAGRFFRWVPAIPAAPTSLTFTNITPTTTTLNWTDNATNEIGYAIYRSDDGGSNYNFITQVPQNINTFTQSFLTPSTTYFYRVIAVSEGGKSPVLQGSQTTSAGTAITSTGAGGNWSATTTWVGGVVPSITDNVTIADGATVIIDIPNAYCNNLTVGQGTSGILRYSAVASASLFANGNVTVAAGGIFDAASSNIQTHTLTIGGFPANGSSGNLAVNGTFDLNSATSFYSGAGVSVTFGGFGNGTISGTGGICDFYRITVNKGNLPLAWQNPILDVTRVITINAPASAASRLIINSGTFKLSSASTLTPYFASQTICAVPGRLWLNHAGASVSQVGYGTLIGAGGPSVNGELRIDDGVFSYGSGSNTMSFNTTISGAITYGGRLTMNGGTLNMAGGVAFTGNAAVYFNMSGGNFNINPQSANMLSTSAIALSFGSGTSVNWTGGTVTIVNPHSAAGGTSVSFAGTFGTKNITGGTLQIGDGISGLASGPLGNTAGFLLSLTSPVYNLVINNRTDLSPTRICRISSLVNNLVYNDVTVNANAYLQLSTSGIGATLGMYGNLINNGTIAGVEPNNTGMLGVLQFVDTSGTQTVSGSGLFTNINQLTLAPATTGFGVLSNNTVVFNQTNSIVVNTCLLGAGTLTHNGKLTIGRPSIIPIIRLGGVGVLTPPGSFTTVPTIDNTSFPLHLFYEQSSIAYTMGAYNEIDPGVNTVYNLNINNTKGLTIGRNLTVVNFLAMTNGNINIGNNNLTIGNGPTSVGGIGFQQGNIICGASGMLTRWYNTTTAPTSSSGTAAQFPVGSSVIGELRHVWVFFNSATALSAAGTISVRHSNVNGLSTMTGYTENSVTMDTRTNSSWNFITGNGITLGTGTISLAIRGDGALTIPLTGTVGNLTITDGTGAAFAGTFSAGTGTATTPLANRTGITSFTALTSSPIYLGSPASNIQGVVMAVTSGSWNTPATWNGNAVPTASDNVVIGTNVVVTTAGGAACVANNVQIAAGGTLNVDGNTVTFGRNLTLAGVSSNIQTFARLNVSAGTLTVTGDATGGGLLLNTASIVNVSGGTLNVSTGADCSKQLLLSTTSSIFNFSGGRVNVYGSVFIQGGVMNQTKDTLAIYPLGPIGGPITSAASANNHSFQITGNVAPIPSSFTGGTLMIVDPPFSTNFHSIWFNINVGTASPFAFTANHTVVIGDGVSTATSPQNNPFRIEQYNGSLNSFMPLNNLVINSGSSTLYRQAQTSSGIGQYGTFVRNTLTVNSGSEFRQILDNMFGIGRALVNNGTFTQMPNGSSQGLHLGFSFFGTLQQMGDVSISGTGVFRNDTLAPTGSFRTLRVTLGSNAYRAIINVNNLSVATASVATGVLTLNSGSLDLGTNNFTLGNPSALTVGTLAHVAGSQILTSAGGSFTRVFPTTGLPTTATVGNIGHYPFGRLNTLNNTVERRDAFVFFSNASALTTGGTIRIAPVHVTSNISVTSFNDGLVTGVDTRSNTNWNVSNTGLVASGTIALKMVGENIGILPSITSTNTTLMLASGIAAGTYAANSNILGATIPDFNRTGLSVTNISNVNYYAGIASGNNMGGNIVAIANGDWNNTATWNTGTIPTATDNVQILPPYTVIMSSTAVNNCNNLTVSAGAALIANTNTLNIAGQINNLGTVTIGGATVNINNANTVGVGIINQSGSTFTLNGGTLNVGPSGGGAASFTLSSNSTININSGTFNMNGSMLMNIGNFNMSGGVLNVDGNSNALATSVPSGTNLVSFQGAVQNITGGIITVVDPPLTGTGLAWVQTQGTNWSNAVLRFGDGVSTHSNSAAYAITTPASTQTSGFGVAFTIGTPSTIIVNGNGTNRWVTQNTTTSNYGTLIINPGSEFRTALNIGFSTTVTLNGNLINNGTFTTTQNTTLNTGGVVRNYITGTGVFRVDTTGTIPANINNLTISNNSGLGVDMSTIGNITIGGYATQSGALSLSTNGFLHIGSNILTIGTSATNIGSIVTATGFVTHSAGGGLRRWISATAAPTTVGLAAQFPLGVLVNGTPLRRDFYPTFSTTGITSGGTLTVSLTNTAGSTAVTAFTDGTLTNVDTRANSYWTVTNSGVATAGIVSVRAVGNGALFPVTLANTTLMTQTGVLGGTYSAGTGTQASPEANRSGMSLADLTASPGLYIGMPAANYAGNIFSVASGNWSNPATWSTGTVPTATDNVTIFDAHRVDVDVNAQARALTLQTTNSVLNIPSNTLTVNDNVTNNGVIEVSGGTLTIVGSAAAQGISGGITSFINLSAGTINCGIAPNFNRTFNNSGTLTISGGTLNINGNMILGGTFNQRGGSIVVDGNDNSTALGSVASATNIFQINSTSHNVTGGSITIVDPHFGPTGLAFNYNSSNNVNWTNHTLTFGDGTSTTQSGATATVGSNLANLGFGVSTSAATTVGRLTLHNVVVNGNGTNRHIAVATTTSNSLDIGNNLTINSGSELRAIGAATALTGGLNVGGNITNNGRLVIGSNTTLGFRLNASVASVYNQIIGGTGQYLNDTVATCSPCISNIAINNTNLQGVNLSGLTGSMITIDQPLGTISSTLTFGTTGNYLYLGNKNLTLGGSITKPGTLSGVFTGNNNQIITTGAITRWFGTATITSPAGVFPFGVINSPVNFNRTLSVSTGTALTFGGTITASHDNSIGTSSISPSYVDSAVTVNKRTNASWVVTTGNGLTSSGATLTMQVQNSGFNAQNFTKVADLRVTGLNAIAPGISGANSGTVSEPVVVRAGLDQTTLASTYYVGGNSADNPIDNAVIPIAGNTITANQTICSGSTPAGLTGTLPTGGTGTFTYTWLSSTSSATSGFTAASGTNNTQNYTPGTLTQNTWYRRYVVSGLATDTSAAVAITVNAPVASNTATGAQTICSGSTPSAITGSTPTGGTGTYTYTWLSSTSSATSGFAVASGTNNTQSYTSGALTANTWFRRVVSSGACSADTSAAVAITVNPVIAGNTIGSNQSILSGGTPAALTGALPTGGSGTYTYSWLSSTTSATAGFAAASGTNNTQNYTPGALTQNTWYRRLITSGGCSDTSTAVAITITSVIAGNTITANQTICSGSTPAGLTGALPTGGTGTYTYTWLSSTSSATSGFTAASGTNNTQNYTPGALTQNTWYRRYVVSGVAIDTSAAVAITVNTPVASNTATGAQTICSGSIPTGLTGSTPTGGTGTYAYTWLASTTSATAGFAAASGTNNTQNYTPGALTQNTWYRRRVSSGVCNADTSAAVAITVNVAGTWTGTSSNAWGNIANWSCPQVPTSTTNVTINSGAANMPTVSDLQQCNNLTIGTGAVLTITGANAQLNIFGNITNNGSVVNTSNGTTAFTGSTQQTVPAGTYSKLEINNSAGVLLGGSVVLSDSLILVNGIISLGNNSLTLGNNTLSSAGSGTSYVRTNGSGNVVVNNVGSTGKTGNVLIPVGNSSYNPVLLNNTGSNDNFTIWVTDSVTNAYTGSTPTGAKLTSNAVNRTWIINEGTAGGSNVTVTLQWNAGDELSGFNRSAAYVSRYNGTAWNGTSASGAAGTNPYTLSRSGITSFSPFGVGSGGALPVELISFEANKVKNNVLLSWQTASELNNAYFEVERSSDGQVFEALDNSKIKGQGTTQIMHDYVFTDAEALAFAKNNGNIIYYRLKQVDFDGAFDYSEVRSVDMGNRKGIAQVQPNPYNEEAYVVMESNETSKAEIVVTDVKGSVVLSQQSTISEGYNQLLLVNAETLQGGMYFVTIKQGSNTTVMKLVKK